MKTTNKNLILLICSTTILLSLIPQSQASIPESMIGVWYGYAKPFAGENCTNSKTCFSYKTVSSLTPYKVELIIWNTDGQYSCHSSKSGKKKIIRAFIMELMLNLLSK